jgi:hypothetical protein
MILESRRQSIAQYMRWTARVIGLLLAGGFLITLIVEGVDAGSEAIEIAGILLTVLTAVALAGSIFSWWWQWLAGILLVLVAAGLGAHIAVYAGHNHFLAWVTMGLPYLAAGGLFLASWWLTRVEIKGG